MTVPSFSAQLWAAAAGMRQEMEQHPFVRRLLDGTLPRRAFDHYVAQDVHYLAGYAVALQACAALADSPAARTFWAGAAQDTLDVETSLHEEYLAPATHTGTPTPGTPTPGTPTPGTPAPGTPEAGTSPPAATDPIAGMRGICVVPARCSSCGEWPRVGRGGAALLLDLQ